jgi:N-methylhydantoinase B/oxoprolinase/acetone carboxylase alpha subunit
MTLNPDGENRDLPKILTPLKKGDVFRARVGGGGGWGNPLDREANAVLNDVRNELVSIERAKDVYGVIINKVTSEIDIEATQKLRETRAK